MKIELVSKYSNLVVIKWILAVIHFFIQLTKYPKPNLKFDSDLVWIWPEISQGCDEIVFCPNLVKAHILQLQVVSYLRLIGVCFLSSAVNALRL